MDEKVRIDTTVCLITDVYAQPEGGAGGNCHIVLDDGNLEDSHIEWCLGLPDLTMVEKRCLEALLELESGERELACWMYFYDYPVG